MSSIRVDWTRETADFAGRLRRNFSSHPGFAPHKNTPLNGLILFCGKNEDYRNEGFVDRTQKPPPFATTPGFLVPQNGDVHEQLKIIGSHCCDVESLGGLDHPRFLRAVVEVIMAYYRRNENFPHVRQIVKMHILAECFSPTRHKEMVAFDLPSTHWHFIAKKLSDPSEPKILAAMEKHIKKLCRNGGDSVKALLETLKDEIGDAGRKMLSEPNRRFIALAIGIPAKEILKEAILGDLEASLIAMLIYGWD